MGNGSVDKKAPVSSLWISHLWNNNLIVSRKVKAPLQQLGCTSLLQVVYTSLPLRKETGSVAGEFFPTAHL